MSTSQVEQNFIHTKDKFSFVCGYVPIPLKFATLTSFLTSETHLNGSNVRLSLICEMLALSVLNQLKII